MSSAARHTRVRELFHAVLELDRNAREELLAELGDEDADAAELVRALLAAEAEAGDFLDRAFAAETVALGAEVDQDETARGVVGRRIGAWEVLRPLGSGGMGAVFVARRADGSFSQKVALKLIRPGLVSRELIRRFLQERQTLASLDHPAIARLLDGGTTEDGLPYLVMELVDGSTLEEHCAAQGLDLAARVDLFVAVCDAVAHAHRNLVVHRDLKPGNILVTPEGAPKLLDFGIAKLLGSDRVADDHAESLLLTHEAVAIGTAAFASPEQLSGRPVTTGADVYSLGVVLYRLLAGAHPYPLEGVPLVEAIRRVCELDPTPPSRAASERGDLGLARRLRGDLDNIVLLALRKVPTERYLSVAALAADLRAWRNELPVAARRPTAGYRAAKYVRRHRLGVLAAALVLISLVGGLGAAAWSAHQAREQARRADVERAKAEVVSGFLQDLLGATESSAWLSPRRGPHGAAVTVAELLDTAAQRLDEIGDQPTIEAALRRTLGGAYSALGAFAPAERELRQAVALYERTLGEQHEETARALADLGHSVFLAGNLSEAEPILSRALELYRGHVVRQPVQEAKALNAIALCRAQSGDTKTAELLLTEALAVARSSGDAGRSVVLLSRANLGQLRQARGDLAGAESIYREVLTLQPDEQQGWEVAYLQALLGSLVAQRGDLEEAERWLRASLRLYAATAGESFRWAAPAHTALAALLERQGDVAGAATHAGRAVEILAATAPPDSADLFVPKSYLASLLLSLGRAEEAVPLLREALALPRDPADAVTRAAIESTLGEALLALGQRAEAEPLLRRSHQSLLTAAGPEHAYTRIAANRLALLQPRTD